MIPAFVVVALGVNATQALVYSPGGAEPRPAGADDRAVVAFTRRRDIMGAFANSRLTQAAAVVGTVVIVALNVVLVAADLRRADPGARGGVRAPPGAARSRPGRGRGFRI